MKYYYYLLRYKFHLRFKTVLYLPKIIRASLIWLVTGDRSLLNMVSVAATADSFAKDDVYFTRNMRLFMNFIFDAEGVVEEDTVEWLRRVRESMDEKWMFDKYHLAVGTTDVNQLLRAMIANGDISKEKNTRLLNEQVYVYNFRHVHPDLKLGIDPDLVRLLK